MTDLIIKTDNDATAHGECFTPDYPRIPCSLNGEIYIALQCIPRHEVLHIYLLVNSQVDVRLNIAGYLPGDERECWDEMIRKPKYWAICTAPVSRPPEPIKMRATL